MATTPTPAPPTPAPTPIPPAPPAPAPVPAPAPAMPRRHRPVRRVSAAIFWAVVGALAALFAANLAGYGPAIVQHERVRVVLPPQRQAQLVEQPAASHSVAPKSQVAPTPKPTPVPQPATAPVPSAQPAPAPPAKKGLPVVIYDVDVLPAQPAPAIQTPATRIDIEVSTPAGSRVKVGVVEENATRVAPAISAPAPLPAPAPAPSVQTPMPTPPPPVVQPPQVQPPPAPQAPYAPMSQDIQAINARTPARTINVLSGNSIQFRVEIASRWGGTNYGYGSTYGWTPGHEELRYDPRTGTYYRVWVAHPQPGY